MSAMFKECDTPCIADIYGKPLATFLNIIFYNSNIRFHALPLRRNTSSEIDWHLQFRNHNIKIYLDWLYADKIVHRNFSKF